MYKRKNIISSDKLLNAFTSDTLIIKLFLELLKSETMKIAQYIVSKLFLVRRTFCSFTWGWVITWFPLSCLPFRTSPLICMHELKSRVFALTDSGLYYWPLQKGVGSWVRITTTVALGIVWRDRIQSINQSFKQKCRSSTISVSMAAQTATIIVVVQPFCLESLLVLSLQTIPSAFALLFQPRFPLVLVYGKLLKTFTAWQANSMLNCYWVNRWLHLKVRVHLAPSIGARVDLGSSAWKLCPGTSLNLKLLKKRESSTLLSNWAKVWPMQFRGPMENGK